MPRGRLPTPTRRASEVFRGGGGAGTGCTHTTDRAFACRPLHHGGTDEVALGPERLSTAAERRRWSCPAAGCVAVRRGASGCGWQTRRVWCIVSDAISKTVKVGSYFPAPPSPPFGSSAKPYC
eukprot:scaffold7531_cov48-Phaeocystis_antarctica.AAC.2